MCRSNNQISQTVYSMCVLILYYVAACERCNKTLEFNLNIKVQPYVDNTTYMIASHTRKMAR